MQQRRFTRASNSQAHPGLPDAPKPRRSSAQVKADNAVRAAAKEEAAQQKATKIAKVAQIENEVRQKVKETDLEANRPKDKLSIPRSQRPRAPPVQDNATQAPTDRLGPAGGIPPADPDSETARVDELSDPDGSNVESDVDMDLENDAPDTAIKKAAGKKQKKGLIVRDQINAINFSAVMPEVSPPDEPTPGKRRAVDMKGAEPQTKRQKEAQPLPPSGLLANWREAAPFEPTFEATEVEDIEHQRAGLTRGGSVDEAQDEDASPAFQFGGIPSGDEEDVERKAAHQNIRFRSIAKIRQKKPGERYRHKDLPPETAERFSKLVLPMACDSVAALPPWESPTDEELADLWNLVFKDTHPVTVDLRAGSLFLVIKPLIKHGISQWLTKFAKAGVKALEAEYKRRGLATTAEQAELVASLLGDAEDIESKKRPFLWDSVYDDPNAEKSGLFQGRLVAHVFLEHLITVQSLPNQYRVQEPPIGALILAIQAVHRALLYSINGTFTAPARKGDREFSKQNWGDCKVESANGKIRTLKRSTVFLKRIKNLSDVQWADIKQAALNMQRGPPPQKAVTLDEEGSDGEPSADDDDELRDPRYDMPAVGAQALDGAE
ncbi:hypothetical protein LshimejAT787_0410020 [Lyophyllum shimeji]|uniref:Uncharacterized protein n=1 Tax=Lyophyllum shimeji TaxID=47721 RepID=A0A9P3PMC6_LYOSH|nr:hypothetical protein LshimejAT787_0410020 [Lyophyllum shimeji]